MNRKTFFTSAGAAVAAFLIVMVLPLVTAGRLHGYLVIEAPGNIQIQTLFRTSTSQQACMAQLNQAVAVTASACPACRLIARQCLPTLSAEQRAQLGRKPLPLPSVHFATGITTYRAADPGVALAICEETARVTRKAACFPAGAPRTQGRPVFIDRLDLTYGIVLMLVALVATHLVCFLVVRFERLHARLTHDIPDGRPQTFHADPIPRIGGVALWAALLAASVFVMSMPMTFAKAEFGMVILAATPVFIGGLMDDVTQEFGVAKRFALSILSGLLLCAMLSCPLDSVAVPLLDDMLAWAPFALLFTVVAVSGVTNAFNIVDGYNGIATGFGLIASISLAAVSAAVGDALLASASLAMAGALLGLMAWNWPRARLFLGDGGAYLIGFWLAAIAVLLVDRNPQVSPWYPLLLLAHPVVEALYSVFRRKVLHKTSITHPDAHHLHQFIYLALLRRLRSPAPAESTERFRANRHVAPYLWMPALALAVMATAFSTRTGVLAGIVGVYVALYIFTYHRLAPR